MRTADRLRFFRESTLRSYALVFFSFREGFGALLMLATFVDPYHGILGLFAVTAGNAAACGIGFDRSAIRKGYFGFNALLVGLALSYFFDPSANLFFLVFLSSILAAFVAAGMQNVFRHYLGVPALSLPFVLVCTLAVAASVGLGKLDAAAERWVVRLPELGFPGLELFLRSLGAVFFQVNVISGLLVLAALLLYSRLGLALGIAGFVAGIWTHTLFGAYGFVITEQYLGFNYILIAIALGGIFLIPSGSSLLLAMVAAAASVIVMVGVKVLLPPYLPVTAIPFNVITLLFLYALKLRLFPAGGLALSAEEVSSPEENLSSRRANLKNFRRFGVELGLPFHGTWLATQGFDGAVTHRDEWRYAVDFIAGENPERTYKGAGDRLEDYHCYDLPVLACADGKVVFVRNEIPDNAVGRVNERDNWGNVVIIEHAAQYYSCCAHLKTGSVEVGVGEQVKAGQSIGRCGNSGRSPYPHLHFQMQSAPCPGSPTVPFLFSNYLEEGSQGRTFRLRGAPGKNDRVARLQLPSAYAEFFPYSFTHEWVYSVRGDRERTEAWSTDIDFFGNLLLESAPERTRACFTMDQGVFSVKRLEGSRSSALFQFAKLLPDFPLAAGEMLTWSSVDEADYALPRGVTFLLDFLSILGIGFEIAAENRLESTGSSIRLHTRSRLKMRTPFGALAPWRRTMEAQYTFSRKIGLTHCAANGMELELSETRIRPAKSEPL